MLNDFRKYKDFLILSLILFPAIICIIVECNYAVLKCVPNNMQTFFIRNPNDDVWYNLSIGYLISYIFYLLVNFIPNLKRDKKKEQELLPLRCARHRETELLMQDIFMIWGDIFKVCIQNGIINRNEIEKIDDLFNFNMIKRILPFINLSQPAIIYENMGSLCWYDKILRGVITYENHANTYLNRYKDMVPAFLFYNIFYILNKSFIVGQLPILFNVGRGLYGSNISLEKIINTDNLKTDIENTCKYIINIHSWFDEEYKYLIKNAPNAESILKEYNLLFQLDKK